MKNNISAPTPRKLFTQKFISSFVPLLFTTGIVALFAAIVLVQQSYLSVTQNSNNLLTQAKRNIDMLFGSVDSVALAIGQDTRTLDQITEVFEQNMTLSRESRLKTDQYRRFVSSVTNSNPDIFSIYVYANNSHGNFITSAEQGISNLDNFYDTQWYQSYLNQDPNVGTWAQRRSVQRYSFDDPLEFISVYRTVYPLGMRRDGVIVQNIDIKSIEKSLDDLDFANKQQFFILDKDGEIFFSYPDNGNIPDNLDKYIYHSVPSKRYEWNYVSLMPKNVVWQSIPNLISLIGIFLFISLLLSIVSSLIVTKRRYSRIQYAVSILEDKSSYLYDDFQFGAVKDYDEYEYFIENAYKEYIDKKNLEFQLKTRDYKLQIMELMALQSQINPHFLYNTLETIKWESIGLTKSENDVSFMLECLSDILRIALSNPYEKITLGEEISIAQSYTRIIEYRYKIVTFIWECDDCSSDIEVPKLIIQPLLENSIYHGIKEKNSPGKIKVKIYKKNNSVNIKVIDNGIGMSKKQLEQLNKKVNSHKDIHTENIGVTNVAKRLQLSFPDASRLTIKSKANFGTVVHIKIDVM